MKLKGDMKFIFYAFIEIRMFKNVIVLGVLGEVAQCLTVCPKSRTRH